MPRYIDADNAISVFEILADKCADDKVFEQAISVLKDVPSEDVVEVVRCKDCDNWADENGREGLCQAWSDFENSHYRYTPKNGYCSEGERKDDDKDPPK